MDFLYLVLLIGIGIFMVIKPDLCWKMDHFFTVKNGEPTEFYIGVTRLIGIFCVLVGLIVSIVLFVNLFD